MKRSYPIVLTPGKNACLVYVPDFDIYTAGSDLEHAIKMAKDAICLFGIDLEDDHEPIPEPRDPDDCICSPTDILAVVNVDFALYRSFLP